MTAIFVDLRAAFDSMDRGVLISYKGKRNKRGINGQDGRNVKRDKE